MALASNRVEKRAVLARSLAKEGYSDVYVIDHEDARRILTEKRTEILEYLKEHDVDSVKDLAEQLDREHSEVSRDLAKLATYDLVTYEEDGPKKRPVLKHDTVIIEPVL